MTDRPSQRLFFALWPEAGVAERLAASAQLVHRACAGRLVPRQNLHLTLVFLGAVPGEKLGAVRALAGGMAARVQSFALEFDRLAHRRRQGIVWAACSAAPAQLCALVEGLRQGSRAIGIAIEERPFAAHVTLLRKAHAAAALPALASIGWPAADFVLAESQLAASGAAYKLIDRWQLAPAEV